MSVAMSEILGLRSDLSDELRRKTETEISVKMTWDLRNALQSEADSSGLTLAMLCHRLLLDHAQKQLNSGNLGNPDHPVIQHLSEAARLAKEHLEDDGIYDPVEQREITQAVVKGHHALYEA